MEIFENVGRFVWEKDCEVEVLDSGVRRCIKGYIDDLMVAELTASATTSSAGPSRRN